MRINTADQRMPIDYATETTRRADIDDSQLSLLELEIADLGLELEEEKKKSIAERVDCAKHLQELEDAEQELLRCQIALQENGQKLAEAHAEVRDKNEVLTAAEEELSRRWQRVGELEQQMKHMVEQNQQKGIFDTKQASSTDFHGCIAPSHKVNVYKTASELPTSQQHCVPPDSLNRQKTSSCDCMNEALQETLEDTLEKQKKLLLQIQKLEDEVQTLKRELQTSRNEAANKTKEMDVLRSYVRGSQQYSSKKERDVRETETETEKNLRTKDFMISRYINQIEDLQTKNKRIPQLASQISKLESLTATLKSTFQQKEKEMDGHKKKLESAMVALESRMIAMETQHEKKIAEMKESKDALKEEGRKIAKNALEVQIKNTELEKVVKRNGEIHKVFKGEKKILEERMSLLEKVHAEQRSTLGIVFSVDLSTSLMGNPQLLAKDAFRKLIDDLRSKSPKAHVGVVVHAASIHVARQMTKVDSDTSSVLDRTACGGSEDYDQAFSYIVSLLSIFKGSHPKAESRVILISDGEGYSASADVSKLKADGVPCHNIVVREGLNSTSTEEYSFVTGGHNFRYNGSYDRSDIDILIGPSTIDGKTAC